MLRSSKSEPTTSPNTDEPFDVEAEVRRTQKVRQHVMFIDDDEALVYIAARQLERLGYRVSAFQGPNEALRAFRAHPEGFDGIITDLAMFGMSGLELSREILRVRGDIPIIMMSGYVRPEDVRAAEALGIREVVLKPNSVHELATTVQSLLSRARATRPSGER
jgi:CheY-like chemotaxis protein